MLSPEPVPVYHERLDEIEGQLAERGSLGLLVLDASRLGDIEDAYGSAAYQRGSRAPVHDPRRATRQGLQERSTSSSSTVRGAHVFLFFLDRKRRKALPFTLSDLRSARLRVLNSLVPNLSRCAFPFTKTAPQARRGLGAPRPQPPRPRPAHRGPCAWPRHRRRPTFRGEPTLSPCARASRMSCSGNG